MTFHSIAIPKEALRVGPLDPDHRIDFTVVLCSKAALPAIDSASANKKQAIKKRTSSSARRPTRGAHLSHAELREKYGAIAGAVELVETSAKKLGLKVIEVAPHGRSLRLLGRAKDVARAFKTSFEEFELHGHRFFAPVGPISMPVKWKGVVQGLFGLHSSQRTWPRRRLAMREGATTMRLENLAQAYAFPPGLDGSGETIGIVEFGGGFYQEDIEQFCSRMGVAAPRITVVEIGSGANRPASRREVHKFLDAVNGKLALAAKTEQSDPFLAAQCTAEVTMDIEIVAALAPGAHLVVYFASSEEEGLYHAISRAVHDEQHKPGVLSVSWSVAEHSLPQSEIHAIEGVLKEAAHLGITVCGSSGDFGALNGSKARKPSVNYPASSPHCLACGGTSGKIDGKTIADEVVWNATHFGIKGASGGGVSELFELPAWQEDARVPVGPGGKNGRGVPDVAGLADPRHGCELLVAGRCFASSGTSAVAPLWAALVARLNQALGRRCGHLHAHIYRLGKERKTALRHVIKGDNGFYRAGEGWNACAGYGTPRGDELLAALRNSLKD